MTTSRKKVVTEEENKKALDKLVNEIIFTAHLRYKVNNTESLNDFFKGDTFIQIVKEITAITGIGNKSKYFFERRINHQMLSIVMSLYSQQFYSMPKTNSKGELEEPRELSELGEEYPNGPFLHRVMATLLSDLEVLYLFKKEVTKELKAGSYSVKTYKEISEDYLVSNFQEFHNIATTAKSNSKDSVEDKFTKLEKEKQKKSVKKVVHPLEKAGRNTLSHFEQFEHDNKTGNYVNDFLTQRREDRVEKVRPIGTTVSLNLDKLDELKTDKDLTPFDGTVHNAIANVFYHNPKILRISMYEIAFAMGYGTQPSKSTIKKIRTSLQKMSNIKVSIDNEEETKRYNYELFNKSDVPLIPVQIVDNVEGKTNNTQGFYCKHLFYDGIKVTPLFDYAMSKKQVTTLPLNCYQAKVSRTDTNIRIRDYLLYRIKTDKADPATGEIRVKLKTILSDANITKEQIEKKDTFKKTRNRAVKTIEDYLVYWEKNTDLLNSWRIEKNNKGDEILIIKK